ncbi:MAG: prepilin-type N-terminal cleavage/methylation domain-containing protein [Gammaproteobacteria bacterium]|nr:prepilin-type N-terminal cleavage/methylation domain-containing protein [Gammaproteobacteria bacterium]
MRTSNSTRPTSGFTLIELVIAMALVAFFTTLAVPNLREWVADSKLNNQARNLVNMINMARATARATKRVTGICFAESFDDCKVTATALPYRFANNIQNQKLWVASLATPGDVNSWTVEAQNTIGIGTLEVYIKASDTEIANRGSQGIPTGFSVGEVFGGFPFAFAPDGAYLHNNHGNRMTRRPGKLFLCSNELQRAVVVDIPEYSAPKIEEAIIVEMSDDDAIERYNDACTR